MQAPRRHRPSSWQPAPSSSPYVSPTVVEVTHLLPLLLQLLLLLLGEDLDAVALLVLVLGRVGRGSVVCFSRFGSLRSLSSLCLCGGLGGSGLRSGLLKEVVVVVILDLLLLALLPLLALLGLDVLLRPLVVEIGLLGRLVSEVVDGGGLGLGRSLLVVVKVERLLGLLALLALLGLDVVLGPLVVHGSALGFLGLCVLVLLERKLGLLLLVLLLVLGRSDGRLYVSKMWT